MTSATTARAGKLGHDRRFARLVANRYRLGTTLGVGSRAVVFAATNVVTRKQLAIKWPVKRGELAPALREARIAARVRSPNVVDVYDIAEHDGFFFLCMERLGGPTLRTLLARRPLDERGFGELLHGILVALAAMHASGVVHCDLKPANIVFADERARTAKLVDLGSAKLLGGGSRAEVDAGAFHPGTSPYMPSEQRAGSTCLDERTDIYALGALILRVLGTGRVIAHPPRLAALREVAQVATATQPGARFASAPAFRQALTDARCLLP